MRCAVVGAGAWGTALADLLARNGHTVLLWAREPDVVESVNASHENLRFLKGAALAPTLRATGDIARAVEGAEHVTYAAPSHVLREVVRRSASAVLPSAVALVATKGIERDTLWIMTDVVASELPGRAVVAVSGPSFAAEVAARPSTFAGLAGIGDLVLTCTGALSRNRAVGVEVGQGAAIADILAGRETVAEGVINTQSAKQLADRCGVEMPIVDAVHRILFEGRPPREAIGDLMSRELRAEED